MKNQALTINTGISRAAEILDGFESRRLTRIHEIVAEQRATIRENLLEGIDEDIDLHAEKTKLIKKRLQEIGIGYTKLDKVIVQIAEDTTKRIHTSLNQLIKIEELIAARVEESTKILRALENQNKEQNESSILYEHDLQAVEQLEAKLEEARKNAEEYNSAVQKIRKEGKKPTPELAAKANSAFQTFIQIQKRLEFYTLRVSKNRLSTSQKYESYLQNMEKMRTTYVSQMETLNNQIQKISETHKEEIIKLNKERIKLGADKTTTEIIQAFEEKYSKNTKKFDETWK